MILASYIRVSSQEQVKYGDSLDGQKKTILRWAKENGHSVRYWYVDEGKSAYKNNNRPNFCKLINDIKNEHISVQGVIVYSISRFSRNLLNQLQSVEIMRKKGVVLLSTTEPLPENANTGSMMLNMLGMINESQSAQNSQTVRNRLADTARKGYFTGGPVPFGYQSIKVNGLTTEVRHKLEVHAEEAEVIKKIFRLADSGINGKAMGIKAITTFLNENGIKLRGKTWAINTLARILRSTVYIGKFIYRSKSTDDNKVDEIVVNVPEIISEALFTRVGKGLEERRVVYNNTNKGSLSKSLLTGLLKCGYCGANLCLMAGKNGRYKYYSCSQKRKRNVSSCQCPNIPKGKLDDLVIKAVLENVLKKEFVYSSMDRINHIVKLKAKEALPSFPILTHKKSKLEQEIALMLDQLASGTLIASSSVNNYISDKEKQIRALEADINELRNLQRVPLMKFGDRHVEKFLREAKKLLSEQNEEATKQFLLSVISKIKVSQGAKKIELTLPNLGVTRLVSKTKLGTDFSVPSFVSMWRRDRDLNTRNHLLAPSLCNLLNS